MAAYAHLRARYTYADYDACLSAIGVPAGE